MMGFFNTSTLLTLLLAVGLCQCVVCALVLRELCLLRQGKASMSYWDAVEKVRRNTTPRPNVNVI